MKTEAQYQTTMHVNNQNCADDELKKSAGEILNGIKRTVEVQVVNPSTFNFQDQTILGKSALKCDSILVCVCIFVWFISSKSNWFCSRQISPTIWIPYQKIKLCMSAVSDHHETITTTFAANTLQVVTWSPLNWASIWTQMRTMTMTVYLVMNSIWIILLRREIILWPKVCRCCRRHWKPFTISGISILDWIELNWIEYNRRNFYSRLAISAITLVGEFCGLFLFLLLLHRCKQNKNEDEGEVKSTNHEWVKYSRMALQSNKVKDFSGQVVSIAILAFCVPHVHVLRHESVFSCKRIYIHKHGVRSTYYSAAI